MEIQTIAILLAIYEPREDWLAELLDSLNAQTYPHLKLYVRDDASPTYPFARLKEMVGMHITAFPYEIFQNEKNLGSNGTFGALVTDCNEPLIAFCDQDDVWLPEKLEKTARLFRESPLKPLMVCTNVSVMDGDGNQIASRMEEHRKRHVFLRGDGIAPTLINRNFVMGCTMGTAAGALFSTFYCLRMGIRGRELMGSIGKTMMQSGGTFGTLMAIGMGIRC